MTTFSLTTVVIIDTELLCGAAQARCWMNLYRRAIRSGLLSILTLSRGIRPVWLAERWE
jgi:hypothetical protein